MNPLRAENYSNYTRNQLASGRITPEQVAALLPKLPLSIKDVHALIESNTPAHHDPEVAAATALRRAARQCGHSGWLRISVNSLAVTPPPQVRQRSCR